MSGTFRIARNPDPDLTLPHVRWVVSPNPMVLIVVEDRWADVFRLTYVAPSMVAEMLAAAQLRYPNVPIVFCENRQLAQEWTYRYLGAAVAYADEEAVDVERGF